MWEYMSVYNYICCMGKNPPHSFFFPKLCITNGIHNKTSVKEACFCEGVDVCRFLTQTKFNHDLGSLLNAVLCVVTTCLLV